MKRASHVVIAAAIATLVGSSPVLAQGYPLDLGVFGGFQYYTAMMDNDMLGNGASSVAFKPGLRLGAQATWWVINRLGIRADMAFTSRPVAQSSTNLASSVHLWDGTADVLFRPLGVPAEWHGTQWLPYIAAGAGFKWINPATNTPTTNGNGGAVLTPAAPNGTGPYFLEQRRKWEFLGAVGADARVSRSVALRLEVGDRIWDPTVNFAQGGPATYTLFPTPPDDIGEWVHEIYAQVGVHLLVGLKPAPKAAPVQAPPPPPPAPAPAPPPKPAERSISVCVVDPGTMPAGARMVTATYVPSTGDTLVDVNGQRQPLSQTVASVMMATQADWYMAGRPMDLTVARRQIQFVTYGSTRPMDAGSLVLLGTVNGLPVYAAHDEVADFADQWQSMQSGRQDHELAAFLTDNPTMQAHFDKVQEVYVPMQAVGCVFQGLQRVQEVKKGR